MRVELEKLSEKWRFKTEFSKKFMITFEYFAFFLYFQNNNVILH